MEGSPTNLSSHLKKLCFLGFLAVTITCLRCNPEVEVYAPERELYAVYGVLNPKATEQHVFITKVFQTEGDAYLHAAQNDLTARNMTVTLGTDSTLVQAMLVDIRDSLQGLFPLTTGVYRFSTTGSTALQPGKRYQLRITQSHNPDFLITAWTEIPTAPKLTSPGAPYYSELHQTYTFPTLEFSKDETVTFDAGTGMGFELRIYVNYWDGESEQTAQWGPTAIFQFPVRCRSNFLRGEMCYQITAGSVPNTLHAIFDDYHPDTVEVIDTIRVAYVLDSLNTTVWMEVTAVDSMLTQYLLANNPFGFGTNLLLDKPEFSNIGGGNTGIFGSYHAHSRYIFLSECTRWLAGLRGKRPRGCDP